MSHNFKTRVYYEDTDAGGVVYHANFFKFTERARTEFLRESGLECSTLAEQENVLFVVRHIEADYIKPAHLDDMLCVRTSPVKAGTASFVLQQDIYRDEVCVFASKVTLVTVDPQSLKPKPFPQKVRDVVSV